MKTGLKVLLPAVALAVSAGCNDPQTAVANLFAKNGLHVLSPVRTYIALGGLVIVPKGGAPYYVDPLDAIPAAMQPDIIDFKSVLADQAASDSSGLTVAINAMKTLIKAPVSFSVTGSQQVKLAQVEASGTRMKIPAVQSYILSPNSSKQIQHDIGLKGKAFIIYEVYRGKNLSIEAQGGQALNVGLAIGASTQGTSGAGAASGTSTPAPAAAATPNGCAASAAPAPAPAPSPAPDVTASGYWVRASSLRLSLCGTDEYPFAVRVAQVVKSATGELELRPGNFHFPGALAAPSDVERYTATISESGLVRNLQRRHIPQKATVRSKSPGR